MARREIDVYVDIDGTPQPLGHAWFSQRRGGPVTTVFAYSPTYLSQPTALSIDPNLQLVTGNQYIDGLPGAFHDCAPDRWGRNLIEKRHRFRSSDQKVAKLNEVDFLVGVSDKTRQGALRFADPESGQFLSPSGDVPKLIKLPELLRASEQISEAPGDFAAVKALLDAGSGSLGGARPKASVMGSDGELLIAKFPHSSDEWDVMAWECVALDLAANAGIAVTQRNLVSVGDQQNVLLLRRFDRTVTGNRIPYLSAMSMLGASDGEWHDYTELAEAISDFGSASRTDLVELYRRMVFSVAIHNTDDHLRNHGFLASAGGWTFAPIFDVNPNPDVLAARVTGIAGATARSEERDGLAVIAGVCRLDQADASLISEEVVTAVAKWRSVAAARGIPASEHGRFADVLERLK